MIRSKFARSLTLAVFASVALACGDTSPTGPVSVAAAPMNSRDNLSLGGLLGGVLQTVTSVVGFVGDATGLTIHPVVWAETHPKVEYTASATISQWGGTIAIPNADFTITFPYGAVSQPVTITITADPNYVAYRMQPAGIHFAKPAVVTQRLRNTSVAGHPVSGRLFGAYISDDFLDLSQLVNALEIELSATLFGPAGVPDTETWTVNHFSRYMLASD